jgi:hypothetical protein
MLHGMGHAGARVLRAPILLGADRVLCKWLAVIIDEPELDIRAADIDADKIWFFRSSHHLNLISLEVAIAIIEYRAFSNK